MGAVECHFEFFRKFNQFGSAILPLYRKGWLKDKFKTHLFFPKKLSPDPTSGPDGKLQVEFNIGKQHLSYLTMKQALVDAQDGHSLLVFVFVLNMASSKNTLH